MISFSNAFVVGRVWSWAGELMFVPSEKQRDMQSRKVLKFKKIPF